MSGVTYLLTYSRTSTYSQVHAHGTMWYRSFPSLLTDAHEVLAGRLPAGLLTEADRVLHTFLRCRRESG